MGSECAEHATLTFGPRPDNTWQEINIVSMLYIDCTHTHTDARAIASIQIIDLLHLSSTFCHAIKFNCVLIELIVSVLLTVWDSMVEGHASKPAKRTHHSTDSPIREPIGQYERNPLFDDNASNTRLNEASNAAASSQQHHSYAMDMDSMYAASPYHSEQQQPEPTNVHVAHAPAGSRFLTGPMIIRVRPDGTPVEEDSARQLPHDDDREAMTIGRAKMPTVQQIASEFSDGTSETAVSYRTAVRTY